MGSGIGRALALVLEARGCALALADINAVALSETAALVNETSAPKVTPAILDVADWAAVWRVASEVEEQRSGGAPLPIYEAGGAPDGFVEDLWHRDAK